MKYKRFFVNRVTIKTTIIVKNCQLKNTSHDDHDFINRLDSHEIQEILNWKDTVNRKFIVNWRGNIKTVIKVKQQRDSL